MTEATKIPTGATPLDVMIGALENEIAALRKQNDALVAALEAVEWAVPPTHIQTNPAYDGACPSCYAGKPVRNHKFYVIPAEYHMKDCQLAAALEQVK